MGWGCRSAGHADGVLSLFTLHAALSELFINECVSILCGDLQIAKGKHEITDSMTGSQLDWAQDGYSL